MRARAVGYTAGGGGGTSSSEPDRTVVRSSADVDRLLATGLDRAVGITAISRSGHERELERLAVRIERHRTACGCEAGAAALLVAALAYPAAGWLAAGAIGPPSLIGIVRGIGVVLAAALAGKLGGILWARVGLRRDLRRIRAYYQRGG